MRGPRAAVGGAGVCALLLLAACAQPAQPIQRTQTAATSEPSVVAPRLSASVEQYRRDAQRGVLQVKVRNEGSTPVRITRVQLDTSTFTAPVAEDKDSRVAPGVAADLTVPLGDAACVGGSAEGTDARAGEHAVTLEVDGATVVLPVDPGVLRTVGAERCAALAVAEQVDLAVAPTWADAGQVRGEPVLRGAVVATPQPGAGAVRLAVEGATTLFTVAEPAAADLPAGSPDSVLLDVVLSVTRCDPHAVAEDKKGYLLPVRVSVDGAEEVLVEVAVPVPERGPLQELVDRTCGFG